MTLGSGTIDIGDIIEVKKIEKHGVLVKEKWYPAMVKESWPDAFGVQILKTDELIVVSLHERGNQWR